jgi:hypothetical protein
VIYHPDDVIYRLDVQLSKASSVQTTKTFRLDLSLCQEVSNCSSLHPSGRFSSTFGRHLVFDKLCGFYPKQRYWKITATVWTMWIPIRTRSSIRQVSHSKSRRSDAKATPFGRGSNQERISAKFLESRSYSCPSGHPMNTVRTVPRFFKPDTHLNLLRTTRIRY